MYIRTLYSLKCIMHKYPNPKASLLTPLFPSASPSDSSLAQKPSSKQ